MGYNNPNDKRDPKNGFVRTIRCIKMELGEPDEQGRRRPVEVQGSEFELEVDSVIMSIGTSPNPLIKATTRGLDTNKWGGIIVEENTGDEQLFNDDVESITDNNSDEIRKLFELRMSLVPYLYNAFNEYKKMKGTI